MIYKLTSINTIISKIVRDLNLGDKEIPYQDIIEWIAEGLEHIGSYYQLTEKEAIICIENHKGLLPCDFHKSIKFLQGCGVHGIQSSFAYWSLVSKSLENSGYKNTNPEGTVNGGDTMQILDMASFQKLQLIQYRKTNTGFNKFYEGLSRSHSLMSEGLTYTPTNSQAYSLNFDVVTANFRYGFIALRYLAIPVDENGYPLIPDNVSFFDAMMWKVAYQLSLRGYEFKNPRLNDFEACKFYWNQYLLFH